MMKKIFALISVVLAALVLTACSVTVKTDQAENAKGSKKTATAAGPAAGPAAVA